MSDRVFFYGTLMTRFNRRRRIGIDADLVFIGRGSIEGALFDLGLFPAAVPSSEGRVWGEVFQMLDVDKVLAGLDDIEGACPGQEDFSLYFRAVVPVRLEDGSETTAWVYFYNAPLGQAERIASGDYFEHLNLKP
jgi:gamma-glutamylcyclotransferase (GGCT)/AIG2-like uncharacterized protein YtfP